MGEPPARGKRGKLRAGQTVKPPKGWERAPTEPELTDFLKNLKELHGNAQGRLPNESVTTLASALSKEWKRQGRIDFRGKVVKSARDLVALAEVLRNPRYETLRIFWVKGDEVVAHEAWSSSHPASSPLPNPLEPRTFGSISATPISLMK